MADRQSNGKFAAGNGVRKAKTAPGSNGVRSSGGIIQTGERSTDLTGMRKWVTYANAFSFPPVAIAALLRYALASGVNTS